MKSQQVGQAALVQQLLKQGLFSSHAKVAFPVLAMLGISNPSRLVGWLLENGGVWLLCWVRSFLPEPQRVTGDEESKLAKLRKVLRNIALCMASNLIAEQGSVILLHLLSTYLFGHVAPFRANKGRPDHSPLSLAAYKDWLRGNGVLQIFGGGLLLGLIESYQPEWTHKELSTTAFRPLQFLRNFFVFRVVVDAVFYAGHRTLHKVPWLYNNVHRRHHEHYFTSLATNMHFSAPDLFIESALPVFAAFAVLRGVLGVKLSRFEMHVFLTYAAWHESGTHLGKPLPLVTAVPPLSILYNSFVDVDAATIQCHETHHNARHFNFGITPILDVVFGTFKLRRPSSPAAAA